MIRLSNTEYYAKMVYDHIRNPVDRAVIKGTLRNYVDLPEMSDDDFMDILYRVCIRWRVNRKQPI